LEEIEEIERPPFEIIPNQNPNAPRVIVGMVNDAVG
jgi:hypothetical protein